MLLDDEDLPLLSGKQPWVNFDGYAEIWLGGERQIAVHRLVMAAPSGQHVHHRNGDKLDNRKANLEVLSPSEHASLPKVENRGELAAVTVAVSRSAHRNLKLLAAMRGMTMAETLRCVVTQAIQEEVNR